MAGWDRSTGTSSGASETYVAPMNPTNPSWSSGSGSSSSSGSSFTGISNPEALAALMSYIQQAANGGTEDYKAQRANRNQQINDTRLLMPDFTKEAAFSDAALLMEQNLRQSMEKNMPSIARAIQGAGTSASSMQGLLSQKLATESAQAAGALGAEQARAYGNTSAQLSSVLEALTRIDPSNEQGLIAALGLLRNTTSNQSSQSSQSQASGGGGGGGGGGSYRGSSSGMGSSSGNTFSNSGNQGALSNNNFGEQWGDSTDYYDPGTYGTIDVPFTPTNDYYVEQDMGGGGSDYGFDGYMPEY